MTDMERITALEAQCLSLEEKFDALLLVVYEQGMTVDNLAMLMTDISGTNASGVAVIKYDN